MSAGTARAGRPRSADVDRAILEAAVEILCEAGFEGIHIEAVAARAGVGRPSVYRRYADRQALIEAAVRDSFERDVPVPDPSEDALHDVIELLASTVHMLKRTPIGPVFRAAIPQLPRQPALGRLANELGGRRRVRLRAAMERARAQGSLPADRDLDRVIDGILGAIYLRYFITGRRLDRRYVRSLLDSLA